MEEKRNIQISLKEAREWYNSDDSFKKELALKAYKEKELLDVDFNYVYQKTPAIELSNIENKAYIYRKLLVIANYLNKKHKPTVVHYNYIYYLIAPKQPLYFVAKDTEYKDLCIKATSIKPYDNLYFNSLEAAKQAIDILGDKLKILFE